MTTHEKQHTDHTAGSSAFGNLSTFLPLIFLHITLILLNILSHSFHDFNILWEVLQHGTVENRTCSSLGGWSRNWVGLSVLFLAFEKLRRSLVKVLFGRAMIWRKYIYIHA